ncbi:CAAX prenyl protease-related protein [Candidatus Poribacteria bacterium]|nr:CAAX prenyl protease-related protein [Candidatus Poribacteria bacterium]
MISYISPFISYLLLTNIISNFPDFYPLAYSVCVILVSAVTIYSLYKKKIFQVHSNIIPGILFGIAGIILWILLGKLNLESKLFAYLPDWIKPSPRPSFNPFQSISEPFWQWGFIVIRVIGIAILVPIAEEIFWRGFLLRWIISTDWENQEIGKFTIQSFSLIVLLFTLAHPEWLAAIIYSILINILLYWKRDIWNCIVAHSISNLILVIYIIHTKSWGLW